MTSLEGLFSGESTRPDLRPLGGAPPTAARPAPARPDAGGPAAPGTERASRAVFESPVVRVLFRATRELVGHRPLEELFPLILDLSIEAVGAERGVLMAYENGHLTAKAVHGEGFRISTTVRDRVLVDKSSVLVKDMQQEEAFRLQQSISAQNIHTMMAVPLQTDDRVIGLIYVDSRLFVRQFHEDDLNLLTVLANVAAIRIEQERFAKLERENEQAAKIQRGILPARAPQLPGLDVAGHNAPCLTVGGDYYDYLCYGDGKLGLVLGDVAGKGMAAALLMSNLQARVQILAEQPGELAAFMTRLDKSIAAQCPRNRFITFFFGVVDPATGRLDYCNAGHNPPLLVRADGTVETLETSGTVLGMLPELGYTQQSAQLGPGDMLAVFSDGVTEASGRSAEEFGESRLAEVLLAHREEPAAAAVEAVLARLDDWTGPAPAEDDVTLVVLRRTA